MLPSWCDEQPMSSCAQCGTELYEGEGVLEFDDEHFCEKDCLLEFIGAEEIILSY